MEWPASAARVSRLSAWGSQQLSQQVPRPYDAGLGGLPPPPY
ncbi:hypothetical protein [Streptomyces sp. 404i]|nr:hypothetical protein [Streptomyces sp. 404i]